MCHVSTPAIAWVVVTHRPDRPPEGDQRASPGARHTPIRRDVSNATRATSCESVATFGGPPRVESPWRATLSLTGTHDVRQRTRERGSTTLIRAVVRTSSHLLTYGSLAFSDPDRPGSQMPTINFRSGGIE